MFNFLMKSKMKKVFIGIALWATVAIFLFL